MRAKVDIVISSPDPSVLTIPVWVEGRKPGNLDTWERKKLTDVKTNKTTITFYLEKGERLVIQDLDEPDALYDKEQGAAVKKESQVNTQNRADKATENVKPVVPAKHILPGSPGDVTAVQRAAAEKAKADAQKAMGNPNLSTSKQPATKPADSVHNVRGSDDMDRKIDKDRSRG